MQRPKNVNQIIISIFFAKLNKKINWFSILGKSKEYFKFETLPCSCINLPKSLWRPVQFYTFAVRLPPHHILLKYRWNLIFTRIDNGKNIHTFYFSFLQLIGAEILFDLFIIIKYKYMMQIIYKLYWIN